MLLAWVVAWWGSRVACWEVAGAASPYIAAAENGDPGTLAALRRLAVP